MTANYKQKLTSVPRGAEITADLVAARWRLIGAPEDAQCALLDAEAMRQMAQYQHRIENFIGTVKVPVGIAGPLRVRGTHANGDYYVPLATTEAALVASYSRGAGLISAAGGCRTAVLEEASAGHRGLLSKLLTRRVRSLPGYAIGLKSLPRSPLKPVATAGFSTRARVSKAIMST